MAFIHGRGIPEYEIYINEDNSLIDIVVNGKSLSDDPKWWNAFKVCPEFSAGDRLLKLTVSFFAESINIVKKGEKVKQTLSNGSEYNYELVIGESNELVDIKLDGESLTKDPIWRNAYKASADYNVLSDKNPQTLTVSFWADNIKLFKKGDGYVGSHN